MKKMLINATQREELRVALVEGKNLYDLDIESIGFEQTKANIYKGKIAKLAPSLDAVFVDYGEEKHGFLPLKEITPSSLLGVPPEFLSNWPTKMKSVLAEGQEILVQISKSERGTKGAALSTYISLAGSYLVLMPNNAKAVGISRRIEGAERQALKQQLSQLKIPPEMGVIVRTAGICKKYDDFAWDLNSLLNYWEAICEIAKRYPAPCLIHQEGSILSRAIRDHVRKDIDEILVDDPSTYALVKDRIALFKPEFLNKVSLYSGAIPLFQHYQIESQIETAFQREVQLPSGGAIVIDSTEALTAIDVNSSRSTKGMNIEETAYLTNLEAAQEISRQFRLRDLGGLVVIDFIDMHQLKHQQTLEAKMRELVKEDRARVQIGTLSRFGLLELSRQRLGFSLRESTTHTCPRCYGRGTVRSNESLALAILRLLEDQATHYQLEELCVLVPVEIGCYLLNEKRASLSAIEKNYQTKIFVVPDENLQTPNYSIHRLSTGIEESQSLSYLLPSQIAKSSQKESALSESKTSADPAAVRVTRALLPSQVRSRCRKPENDSKPGFLKRLFLSIFGKSKGNQEKELETVSSSKEKRLLSNEEGYESFSTVNAFSEKSEFPETGKASKNLNGKNSGSRKYLNTQLQEVKSSSSPSHKKIKEESKLQKIPPFKSSSESTSSKEIKGKPLGKLSKEEGKSKNLLTASLNETSRSPSKKGFSKTELASTLKSEKIFTETKEKPLLSSEEILKKNGSMQNLSYVPSFQHKKNEKILESSVESAPLDQKNPSTSEALVDKEASREIIESKPLKKRALPSQEPSKKETVSPSISKEIAEFSSESILKNSALNATIFPVKQFADDAAQFNHREEFFSQTEPDQVSTGKQNAFISERNCPSLEEKTLERVRRPLVLEQVNLDERIQRQGIVSDAAAVSSAEASQPSSSENISALKT